MFMQALAAFLLYYFQYRELKVYKTSYDGGKRLSL